MTEHSSSPWAMRESATHITVTNASGDALFHAEHRSITHPGMTGVFLFWNPTNGKRKIPSGRSPDADLP